MIPIAAAIGIRAAIAFVGIAAITKTRPSTFIRVAEDGVMGIGTKAKHFVRRTKNEYHARMYAKATENIRKQDADFEAMSPAQRKQATRDQAEILARSAEILAQRNAKPVRNRNRRSSSAGHEATA